jgi:hypothetical protein
MISAATGPIDATPEGLHALYVSLNCPVVSVDSLPVGPAQAAIAMHGEAGTTLLIRSMRTGTIAFFHTEARFGAMTALSHAEQLGFLFDEEVTEDGLGVERSDWPLWLADVFSTDRDPAADLAGCLSKFRWALLADAAPAGRWERFGIDRRGIDPRTGRP